MAKKFSSKDVQTYADAKLKGASEGDAREIAGYSRNTNPLLSKTAQLTLEDAYANAGLTDDEFAKQIKSGLEADKTVALGNGESTVDPDWTNRAKYLELWAKTSAKMSPARAKIDVDVKTHHPLEGLPIEELEKMVAKRIREANALDGDKYLTNVTPEFEE